ncbi:MAG: DegV family protein [Firmicutes bacterium]|nr:DegV family protein [Candidatus Fermentithermobacillaceae bacterium]
MPRVKIVTDSACDIDPKILEEKGIGVVPLTVHFGPESYKDGYEMRGRAFYDKLRTSEYHPRTSQPSPGDFQKVFEELTADGSPVVAILLSSALSGTYQAATIAAQALEGRQIAVVDSKAASIGYGLIALEAQAMAEKGASFEEVRDAALKMASTHATIFSVDTLDYLLKNGRIGRAQHFVGSLLNMKPILTLDRDGYVAAVERVRGSSKVIPRMVELVGERVPFGSRVLVGICHADALDRAQALKEMVVPKYDVARYEETEIGSIIGTHTGPGTLAVIVIPVP